MKRGVGMEERELKLVDLIIEILLCWRGMILCALLGAVLFGGLSYYQSYNKIVAYNETIEDSADVAIISIEEIEEKLTDIQIVNVESAVNYELLYSQLKDYYDSSVLMGIDPNCVPTVQLVFFVNSNDKEIAYAATEVYCQLLNGNEISKEITEEIDGLILQDVNELVSVIYNQDGQEYDQQTVVVEINHNEKEIAEDIADVIIDYITDKNSQLLTEVGEHNVMLLSDSYSEVYNRDLYNKQKTIKNELISYEAAIANLKSTFTDIEMDYYNLLLGEESESDESDNDDKERITEVQISKKMLVLGCIILVFLYVVVIFVKFIFSDKMRNKEELVDFYNISFLGYLNVPTKKKKLLGFIDNKIKGLKKKVALEFDESLDIIVKNIKLSLEKNNIKSYAIVSSCMNQGIKDIYEHVVSLLGDDNVICLGDVLYDPMEIDKMHNVDSVILFEEIGVSDHNGISQVIDMLKRNNIKMLGTVIVDKI